MADVAPEPPDEDTGQLPAHVSDVRRMKRRFSMETWGQTAVVLAAVWAVWRFGILSLLNDAVAANPTVVQHGEAIREIRGDLQEQRSLAIRQLETTIAAADYSRGGARPPILDAPMPPAVRPKDAGP